MYLRGNGEELIYRGRILFSPHRVYNERPQLQKNTRVIGCCPSKLS
jgi:hypothetical protein